MIDNVKFSHVIGEAESVVKEMNIYILESLIFGCGIAGALII